MFQFSLFVSLSISFAFFTHVDDANNFSIRIIFFTDILFTAIEISNLVTLLAIWSFSENVFRNESTFSSSHFTFVLIELLVINSMFSMHAIDVYVMIACMIAKTQSFSFFVSICYDKFAHRIELMIFWSEKTSAFAKSRHEHIFCSLSSRQ